MDHQVGSSGPKRRKGESGPSEIKTQIAQYEELIDTCRQGGQYYWERDRMAGVTVDRIRARNSRLEEIEAERATLSTEEDTIRRDLENLTRRYHEQVAWLTEWATDFAELQRFISEESTSPIVDPVTETSEDAQRLMTLRETYLGLRLEGYRESGSEARVAPA